MWTLFAVALASTNDPLAMEVTQHTLDNGLRVAFVEDHNTDTIALHIRFGVGSHDERPGEFGCAHLFEHLMFEGSANVPQNAFDNWLTGAGGDNNAYTSDDVTAYHMTFPSGALDLALMLESDRLGFLDAGLDQANLDNQRKVVLQERAEGFDEPHGRDWDALAIVGFPKGHGYQHPVIGSIADVEGFEIDGVVDFWKRHYRPRNAVLTLVGNFETQAAMERVEHWFSDVPDSGEPVERLKPAVVELPSGDHVITDKVEDRTLYVMYPGVPESHDDAAAMQVLADVLSDGRGTRLDDRLYYDKKVLQAVSAFPSTSEASGRWLLYATSDSMPLKKVLKKLDKEMARFMKQPPTQSELDRVRKTSRSLALDQLEGLEDRADRLADCIAKQGEPNCTRTWLEKIDAVTSADVMRVARTYLDPEKRVTLSVVPEGDTGAIPDATPVEVP